MIDLMAASPAERSAYGTGALAGQSRGAYSPPLDLSLAAAYTEGFTRNGGKLPKSAAPRAQTTTRRISADPEGLLLARCLRDPRGNALVRRFAQLLSLQLSASRSTSRISVRLAWETARMERTQGPDGSFKSDNRLVGPLARWAILCAHNDLRGRIEVRGEPDQAWHKAEGSRPLSPYPWLDTASPFTPMGSYGVVAPAPFSGTVAEAASAMIDPDDTDTLFPAPGAR